MGFLGKVVKGFTGGGDDLANAAGKASKAQEEWATKGLKYMQGVESLPLQYRNDAMRGLAGVYGLEGGEGSQQDLIDRAQTSPLYAAIMGGKKEGEDAIMRNASATGGLRSGNVQDAMYDFNTTLSNDALLQSYNQELSGLAGFAGAPLNTNNIAQQMTSIGSGVAGGIMGEANAKQAANSTLFNNILGVGTLGMSAMGGMPSFGGATSSTVTPAGVGVNSWANTSQGIYQ